MSIEYHRCWLQRPEAEAGPEAEAEKVLFIEYSSFNPSFMFMSTIFE